MTIRQPPGYTWLEDEPEFDPARHLSLSRPDKSWTLTDFGYDATDADTCPFDLAVTSPFRMLTNEGVEALDHVIGQLASAARTSDRIASFLRGTVYRSRFMRDLCNSADVTRFMTELVGTPVAPHSMPLYQGHVNLKPEDPERDVDQWHLDTVTLDFVLLVTDPGTFEGGAFEYFHGPKQEAVRTLRGLPALESQRVSVKLPGPGWALAQQGNMVVHRAAKVSSGSERTTLVNSYIPLSPSYVDVSRLDDCKPVDPPELLNTEWARHKAFLAREKLQHLIDHLPYGEDRHVICETLREAIRDVETAIAEIADRSPGRLVFFAGDALTDKV